MYISILAHRTWIKYRENGMGDCFSDTMKQYATFRIHPSPAREILRVFGGDKTIEEYRKGFFGIIPPNEAVVGKPFLTIRQKLLLPFMDLDEKSRDTQLVSGLKGSSRQPPSVVRSSRRTEASSVHRHSNAFCDKLNRAKEDNTLMKRKRNVNTNNTLMTTMGVVVETRKR